MKKSVGCWPRLPIVRAVTAHYLVSALLDAVDDVNPRQYLSDVPGKLLMEFRPEMEKLGWTFIRLTCPTEAQYRKGAPDRAASYHLWVYVWEAKLHAYGHIEFFNSEAASGSRDWVDRDVTDMEQSAGQALESFAQEIDTEFVNMMPPMPDDFEEPPGMDEALDPDELPPKEFLKKLPERLMVQLVVDEEASPEGVPPATVDARDYFASRTSAFIARVHRFCKQTHENRAGIAFESDEPASVEALRNMPGAEYIVEYIQRWGTMATMYVSKEALEEWILRERPKLAKRLRLTVAEALDPDEIKPKDYTKGMTPRDLKIQGHLIVIANPEDTGNPLVECPICHFRGLLMDDFSYLEAGFNGIKPGGEDDLDLQECGRCGAKLEWRHIPEVVESVNPDQPSSAKDLLRQLPQTPESWLREQGFQNWSNKHGPAPWWIKYFDKGPAKAITVAIGQKWNVVYRPAGETDTMVERLNLDEDEAKALIYQLSS